MIQKEIESGLNYEALFRFTSLRKSLAASEWYAIQFGFFRTFIKYFDYHSGHNDNVCSRKYK